jgi:hypothetical protein
MVWQLPGRFRMSRRPDDYDVSEPSQLFLSDWSTPQDFDPPVP